MSEEKKDVEVKDHYSDLPSRAEFLSQRGDPDEKLIPMNHNEWWRHKKISRTSCSCPHGLNPCAWYRDYAESNFEFYRCPDFINVERTREKDQTYDRGGFEASVHCRGKLSMEWLCTMFEEYERYAKKNGLYRFEDWTKPEQDKDEK